MANKLEGIKNAAQQKMAAVDMSKVKGYAAKAGEAIADKAVAVKDKAMEKKEDIAEKLTELDRMLEASVTEYNDTFTIMNDRGVKLFVERNRAVDTIGFIESLVNSIANRPKSFDTDFEEITANRSEFTGACEFADKELLAARTAAAGAGAGLAAGASVAFMAPTAAMWIATTFGTASTGVAISTLSGAAAESAALAWLGGGALAASGGGMAAGNALLALAGPIGWTIAGATLLTSIILFAKKKTKLNKEKNAEIESVKHNTEIIRETDAKIKEILDQTSQIRDGVNVAYVNCLSMFNGDYSSFDEKQKCQLGALVNDTKALSLMLRKSID